MELYKDSNLSPKERARDLFERMSIDEKLVQLVGYNAANWSSDNFDEDYPMGAGQVSLLVGLEKESIYEVARYQRQLQKEIIARNPHGVPAIFHVETLCGTMLPGATGFPSGIAQGATFHPELQKRAGNMIGKQARAAGASMALAPVLDISRDSRFGRQGESYGEDPALASAMGCAYVNGLQADGDCKNGVLAAAKHFVGYHDTQGGIHAATCDIPERLIKEVYAKPFQAAISEAGLKGAMPCYSAINGEPVSGSRKALTELLREEMGFEGVVVSDYTAIAEMKDRLMVAPDYEEAGRRALIAGMDQELPSKKCFTKRMYDRYKEDAQFLDAFDRAVMCVLEMKFLAGIFENPFAFDSEKIRELYEEPQNEEICQTVAEESFVLLKNAQMLPLQKAGKKIAVIGHHGKACRSLFGGYTYLSMTESQLGVKNTMAGTDFNAAVGEDDEKPWECYPGTIVDVEHPDAEKLAKKMVPGLLNLYDVLEKEIPENDFTYAYGYPYTGTDESYHHEALSVAADADILLLTVGDKYGFGSAASVGEGIDATHIGLPPCQESFIEKAAQLGKPMVIVHFGGRPISSNNADIYANAILEAWNPGQYGAKALVRTLFGDYNPGGRLPVTVAYNAGQIPIFYNHQNGASYHQNTQNAIRDYMDCPHNPRYYFGTGLSYTTFEYRDLCVEKNMIQPEECLKLRFFVKNKGSVPGDEVVQVYVKDCYASMVRPVMELAGFVRIHLRPGEESEVSFSVPVSQFAFVDTTEHWKIEAGDMEVYIGASSNDLRLRGEFMVTENAYIDPKKRSFYTMGKRI